MENKTKQQKFKSFKEKLMEELRIAEAVARARQDSYRDERRK